ncbi:MAG TPA: hypothetical protein PLB46_00635 [Chitinophagales bacterium]|nr:hypothetical protein [Chitinophagales bacterium]
MKKLWYFIITWILISIPVFIFAQPQPQHNNSAITQTTNTNVLNEVIIIVK